MNSNNPVKIVLKDSNMSEKEKDIFLDIIQYAKICQQTNPENLKPYIAEKIKEVVKSEISKDKI